MENSRPSNLSNKQKGELGIMLINAMPDGKFAPKLIFVTCKLTNVHRRSVGKKSEGAQLWYSEVFGSEDIQQKIFLKI